MVVHWHQHVSDAKLLMLAHWYNNCFPLAEEDHRNSNLQVNSHHWHSVLPVLDLVSGPLCQPGRYHHHPYGMCQFYLAHSLYSSWTPTLMNLILFGINLLNLGVLLMWLSQYHGMLMVMKIHQEIQNQNLSFRRDPSFCEEGLAYLLSCSCWYPLKLVLASL